MDETRDDVAILDTPHDFTHEMTSTQVSRRSRRIIRPPIRFIGLGETYEAISEEVESNPYNYEEAMNDIDAHHQVKSMKSKLDSMYLKVQKRVKTPLNVQTPKLKLNQFKQYVKQQVCGNLTYANIRN